MLNRSVFVLMIATLAGACGEDEPAANEQAATAPPGQPAPAEEATASALPTIALSESQQAQLPEIVGQARNGAFPSAVAIKDNALIFLHLAATSSHPRARRLWKLRVLRRICAAENRLAAAVVAARLGG